jgi:tetratricopeptide (TPR) repeat protein
MKSLLFCGIVLSIIQAHGQNNLQTYTASAREAYKAKDYKTFYESILEAHKLHPYHQGILYQAGLASALTGKPDEAITFLSKAIQINAQYDLEVADLNALQNVPEFQTLKKLQTELQLPIIHSDTAFVVNQKIFT